jgi:hypothetical protein
VRPDWVPAIAETLFVGIAILGNDRRDPFRMAHSETKAGRSAVVEHVDGETFEADDLSEAFDAFGERIEIVFEVLVRRHVGLAEPGKIRRNHAVLVRQQRDQVAKHVA